MPILTSMAQAFMERQEQLVSNKVELRVVNFECKLLIIKNLYSKFPTHYSAIPSSRLSLRLTF